ncbi:MAG: SusD/RagB family nutrient-binding outer membrane lipoprotein [Bacteroidota bacterium]
MNTYKNVYRLLLAGLLCVAVTTSSCDNNFGELNTNPAAADRVDSPILLNFVINRAASSRYEQWRGNLIYTSQWSQQLSGAWSPDRYNSTVEDWLAAYWIVAYGDYMRNIQAILNQEEGTAIEGMALILKVMIMQRVTDMYGDIPYSEAFQGGELPQPVYDTQEMIYGQFVSELRQAIGQLTDGNGANPGSSDAIYGGDLARWRKLGNSILLRVGLRMSEVNPTLAEQLVAEAINGGIIAEEGDLAYLEFDGSMPGAPVASGVAAVFNDFGIGGGGFALSDELVDRLKAADDPRLAVIATKYNSDGSVDDSVSPADFEGRANGGDFPSLFDFVLPNHDVMVAYDSPTLYYTLAEAEFSRAEAIVRGWVSGNAQEAYENGVRAACKQLALYPRSTPITDAEIDALLAQPTVAWDAGNAMNLINTQKWIALLFDGFEAYANFRRTGFPELTPGLTAGETNGQIPQRMRYPISESLTNKANYDDAVSRLSGGDVITAPVWWDAN